MNPTIQNALLYAFVLCAIVALGTLFGLNDVLIIGIVGVLSALVALMLRNTRAFDKTVVDLIYYGVALLGAIVYFWQETVIRDVKAVDSNITHLARSLNEARDALTDFDEQTAELHRLSAERAQLATVIRDDPEKTLIAIRNAEINATIRMSTVEALTCAEAVQLKAPFDDNRSRDRLPGSDLLDALGREQARVACIAFIEDLQRRKEIATAIRISLSDLTDSSSRFNEIGDELIPVDGRKLPISVVIDILRGRDLLAGRAELRRNLEESANTVAHSLSTARANRNDDITNAEEGTPYFVWYLRYQGWPVVLILLLSLKLARSRIS